MSRFKLLKLIKPTGVKQPNYIFTIEETYNHGFLWLKESKRTRRIYGSSTIFYDYNTGERVDISPISRFCQRIIALNKRPEMPNG